MLCVSDQLVVVPVASALGCTSHFTLTTDAHQCFRVGRSVRYGARLGSGVRTHRRIATRPDAHLMRRATIEAPRQTLRLLGGMVSVVASKSPRRSNQQRGRWPIYVGTILLVLALLVAGVMYHAAGDIDLTATPPEVGLSDTENILFSIVMFLLSTAGGILVAFYFAQSEALKNYQALATPSWRRVVQLLNSSDLIAEAIEDKRIALDGDLEPGTDVVHEWLDSLARMLQQHRGQVSDAIADWHEILPEAVSKHAEVTRLGQEIATLQELMRQKGEHDDEVTDKISTLEKKLSQKRSDLVSTTGVAGPLRFGEPIHGLTLSDLSPDLRFYLEEEARRGQHVVKRAVESAHQKRPTDQHGPRGASGPRTQPDT